MKEDNEYLTEMVNQLNSAVAQLMNNQQQMMISQGNQTQLIVAPQPQASISETPHERYLPEEHIEQVSSQIVEWSPSRPRRRSKKTVLQSTERLPPRDPAGTPQVTKKKRVSASPVANRYGVLASNTSEAETSDAEMDEMIELANVNEVEIAALSDEVEARINNLKVHNTFFGPDSSTETGAGLHK